MGEETTKYTKGAKMGPQTKPFRAFRVFRS